MSLYYKVSNCRVRSFIRREDILKKIDDALSTESGQRIVVLQGMNSQGKSQRVLEYCHRKKTLLTQPSFGY